MPKPTDAFTYQEREAYLEEQEQRREHDARMDTHDSEPLPTIPRLPPEEILKERMIAELEGLMEYEFQIAPSISRLVIESYHVALLLTRLKEGEI